MGNGIMDPGALTGQLGLTLREHALKSRPQGSCSTMRIPTNEYPEYSTTLVATFDANGVAEFSLDADRDLLLTDLFLGEEIASDSVELIRINATYCNTKYLINSTWRQWQRCCNSRPDFLVGVRENKSLDFRVTGGTPDETIALTVAGFQGNGCCDGVCDNDRIPTARWPMVSETKYALIEAGGSEATVEFVAQRDQLFNTLSVSAFDSVSGAELPASVYIEYCNTDLVDGTDAAAFGVCCARKPPVLLGMKENKRVSVRVVLDADAEADSHVEVTFTGFQGDSCCN
jgi:hypothetical protein